MTFADTQELINYSWKKRMESFHNDWGQKKQKHEDNVVKVRKNMFCMECSRSSLKVRMDLVDNIKEQHLYSVYDVELWKCPRCGKIERLMKKDAGKGRNGVDSYKETGFTN